MIKVETIEQYHILKHIEENFYIDSVDVALTGSNRVRVTDFAGDSAEFAYIGGQVKLCE